MQHVNRFAGAPVAASVVANLRGAGAAVGVPGGQQDAGIPQNKLQKALQKLAGTHGLVQPGSLQQNHVQPQLSKNSLFFNLYLL